MRRAVLSLISLICLACIVAIVMIGHALVMSATGSSNLAMAIAVLLTVGLAGGLGLLIRKARQSTARDLR